MDREKRGVRFCAYLLLLFLCSCGLKQEIATDVSIDNERDKDPAIENAVFIRKITENHKGTKTQCRLNPILFDAEGDIPVFIEFDGKQIARSYFKNLRAPINFAFYNPDWAGELICVVVYANAEFESEPLFIEPQ